MYHPQLTTFISVAESGSFTKTADALFITPTAVMKQINALEERIGVVLFDRTNHGLMLTEAGKSLLQDARYLIDYSDRAIEKAKDRGQGKTAVNQNRDLYHDAGQIPARRMVGDAEIQSLSEN